MSTTTHQERRLPTDERTMQTTQNTPHRPPSTPDLRRDLVALSALIGDHAHMLRVCQADPSAVVLTANALDNLARELRPGPRN